MESSVRLGDVARIKHGFAFAGEYFRSEPPGDVVVTPGNFNVGGGFKECKAKFYVGPKIAGYYLKPGDLIITMTDLSKNADTLGFPALLPTPSGPHQFLHNQRIGLVEVTSSAVEKRYLYYLLMSSSYRAEILASATGTTVKHTSPSRIEAFRFELPPLRTQRVIASILGMIDNKIELNRRVAATLEAMARALFKSWFINFDPVRARADCRDPGLPPDIATLFPDSFEDSELGEIPTGWRVKRISELGRVTTGKTPSTKIAGYFNGPYPFITIPDLDGRMYIDRTTRSISEAGAGAINSSRLSSGAVLMSCIATVGRCGITDRTSFTNQQINAVTCNQLVKREFLYWAFKHLGDEVERSGGGGSVYTNVSKSRFGNILILVPPLALQAAFAGPWFEKLRGYTSENSLLTRMRDALLPKLISGEICVTDAERIVEKSA